jgi:outer membrane protein assembly factor BamE (lipoprotein component of BamABCDE complex)
MKYVSVGLACCLLAGCLSWGNAKLDDESVLAEIKTGQTTKQEVASLLGEPMEKRTPPAGGRGPEWWSYSYSQSTVNPLEYLLLYGFWVNGVGTPDTRHTLDVFFAPDGTVITLSHMVTNYDLGGPMTPIQVHSRNALSAALGQTRTLTSFADKMERAIPSPDTVSSPLR